MLLSWTALVSVALAQAEREYLNDSCAEVAKKFTASASPDDRQRNEFLQAYKGRRVGWTGTEGAWRNAVGMELSVQCLAGSHTKDVTVSFAASWKPKLAQLTVGQQVQFTGQLDDLSEVEGIVVKQGELGSGRVATPPPESSAANRPVSPPPAPSLPSGPLTLPPAPSSPSYAPAGASVGIPAIQTGDTYVIESLYPENPKLSTTTERKVLSVSDGTITMTSRNIRSKTGQARLLQFTAEWNLMSSRNADGSGFDYAPPLKYFEFPLYPGKTWTQMSREIDIKTGAVKKHMLSATAGNWEEVTVPAGTFRARP